MYGPTSTFPRHDLRGHLLERTSQNNLWVARRVLPDLPVGEKASSLASLPGWNGSQIPELLRAPGGPYAEVQWELEEKQYNCKEYGLAVPIDDSLRARFKNLFDIARPAAEYSQNIMDIRLERAVAAACFNTTTFTGATNFANVSVEWNQYATATPAADIIAPSEVLKNKTGVPAIGQSMVISEKVARNIVRTADYRAAMKVDSSPLGAMWDEKQLALYFGLREVIVARSSYNAANIGQTESHTDIWDDEYALLFIRSEGGELSGPELGRCIGWEEDGGILVVEQLRDDNVRSDKIRARGHIDVKVWGANWGFLLGNITT